MLERFPGPWEIQQDCSFLEVIEESLALPASVFHVNFPMHIQCRRQRLQGWNHQVFPAGDPGRGKSMPVALTRRRCNIMPSLLLSGYDRGSWMQRLKSTF